MDKIAVSHRLLDAVQACLNRITQIQTDLHQSKIKLMIKIMKIDVVDLREGSLIKDGSHGYGMSQRVQEIVQEVDLDLMTGMRNGKDLEIREEMVPDMALEEISEMRKGTVLDMVQEEVLEVMSGKVLDMVHVKDLEEVPEVMSGKVLDMVHVKALEEVQMVTSGEVQGMALVKVPELISGEVQDMALEMILEMKLLNGNSSIIPLMKPDMR